jgi:hypothetical protein
MRSVLAFVLLAALTGGAHAQQTNELGEEIIPNPPKKYAIAVGGAALGLWVVGGILGGIALGKSNAQEGNPADPPVYTSGLADEAKTGASLATASYVFFGLAAAATIVDAVLWYEALRKPRTIKKAAHLQLTPAGVRF